MRKLAQRGMLGFMLFGLVGVAAAQTLSFGNPNPAGAATGTAANGVTVVVSYTAGSNVGSYQADIVSPPEFTSMTSNDVRCVVGQPAANRIRISDINLGGAAIASGTVCTLTFNVANTVPTGNYNFSTCMTGNGTCQNPSARSDILGTNTAQTLNLTYGNAFAVAVASGPTLSPPASTTVNTGGGTIGNTSSGQIQYTAAGGTAGQTTNLSCTAPTGGFTITSGNNQNVATGATPAPIVVSITLTNAAQNGTMSCTANGTTTNFALAAPAGSAPVVSITPAIIPANSNWSLLALIGVLLGVGGLALTLRRNG